MAKKLKMLYQAHYTSWLNEPMSGRYYATSDSQAKSMKRLKELFFMHPESEVEVYRIINESNKIKIK
jgi:hypothetical protein